MVEELNFGSDMLFDLRVFRARMIANQWEKIDRYKDEANYYQWFKALRSLYSTVAHKLGDKLRKEYQNLEIETLKVINNNEAVFTRKSYDAKGMTLLENSLLAMELFLLQAMEDKSVFGKRQGMQGL